MRNHPPRAKTLALIALALLFVVRAGPAAVPLDPEPDLPLAVAPAFEPGRAERIAQALAKANPELDRVRRDRIASAVLRYGHKHGVDPELVAAVLIVESGARPWVRSPKGAIGLMQVMPHMLRQLDLAGGPTTIETNVEAGCMILASNIRRLGEADGISAYFWGSDIRGVAYLNKVRDTRARLREALRS